MSILKLILAFLLWAKLSSSDDDGQWNCDDVVGTNPFLEIVQQGDKSTLKWLKSDNITQPIFKSLDSQEHCPKYRLVVERIKNQAICGNCWSFRNRLCIASGEKSFINYFVYDLMIRCPECQLHRTKSLCKQEGILWRGFQHLAKQGVTTRQCKPYNMEKLQNIYKRLCEKTCNDPDRINYTKEFVQLWRDYPNLTPNAPLCVDVQNNTEEFSNWTGVGVIEASSSVPTRHSIRINDRGVKDEIPYWLCTNSWGKQYGLDALFKIQKSTKEFNIKSILEQMHIDEQIEMVTDQYVSTSTKEYTSDMYTRKFVLLTLVFYFLINTYLLIAKYILYLL